MAGFATQPTLRILMRLAIMTIIVLATESCRVQCRVVYNRPGPRCLSDDNSIAQNFFDVYWRPALIENAGVALVDNKPLGDVARKKNKLRDLNRIERLMSLAETRSRSVAERQRGAMRLIP